MLETAHLHVMYALYLILHGIVAYTDSTKRYEVLGGAGCDIGVLASCIVAVTWPHIQR